MKSKSYLLLTAVIAASTLVSCKKPKSDQTVFSATKYETLGPFDGNGKPLNMTEDVISPAMSSWVATMLPDGDNLTKTHPELFSSIANNDIQITQRSDVYVTFIAQSTDAANALAFYTYPTGTPPESPTDVPVITYIFPNGGIQSTLQAGDKIKLGSFNAGTSIGFVMLVNAWDFKKKNLDNNVTHYCSDDILNPEKDPNLRKHAVFIDYAPEKKTLIGFEDTNRENPNCDNDFSDMVFYTTVQGL